MMMSYADDCGNSRFPEFYKFVDQFKEHDTTLLSNMLLTTLETVFNIWQECPNADTQGSIAVEYNDRHIKITLLNHATLEGEPKPILTFNFYVDIDLDGLKLYMHVDMRFDQFHITTLSHIAYTCQNAALYVMIWKASDYSDFATWFLMQVAYRLDPSTKSSIVRNAVEVHQKLMYSHRVQMLSASLLKRNVQETITQLEHKQQAAALVFDVKTVKIPHGQPQSTIPSPFISPEDDMMDKLKQTLQAKFMEQPEIKERFAAFVQETINNLN